MARRRDSRWLAIYLEHAVDQVHDPVVGDARTRIRASLAAACDSEPREGDVHDQRRVRRMSVNIIPRSAANDGNVRLGLGSVVQADWTLNLNEPPVSECTLERPRDEDHRRPMWA